MCLHCIGKSESVYGSHTHSQYFGLIRAYSWTRSLYFAGPDNCLKIAEGNFRVFLKEMRLPKYANGDPRFQLTDFHLGCINIIGGMPLVVSQVFEKLGHEVVRSQTKTTPQQGSRSPNLQAVSVTAIRIPCLELAVTFWGFWYCIFHTQYGILNCIIAGWGEPPQIRQYTVYCCSVLSYCIFTWEYSMDPPLP